MNTTGVGTGDVEFSIRKVFFLSLQSFATWATYFLGLFLVGIKAEVTRQELSIHFIKY